MSQVTEQSVRFQTALASINLIQASAVLVLSVYDFDFLTSNKVRIAADRSRARRCVEACVYGTLDFVGYSRFPAPVEFIAAVIAYYVHFFFSSRRRHTRSLRDWSSDVCSSDLAGKHPARRHGRNRSRNEGRVNYPFSGVERHERKRRNQRNATANGNSHRRFSAQAQIGRASCRERV